MKWTAYLLALVLVLAACGDDDASSTSADASSTSNASSTTSGDAPGLTADEQEWCSFAATGEVDATRFDRIFEAGLSLGLNMDALNAEASGLRSTYEDDGMTPDEAVQAVSRDLLGVDVFIAACHEAYAIHVGS